MQAQRKLALAIATLTFISLAACTYHDRDVAPQSTVVVPQGSTVVVQPPQ